MCFIFAGRSRLSGHTGESGKNRQGYERTSSDSQESVDPACHSIVSSSVTQRWLISTIDSPLMTFYVIKFLQSP